MSSAYVRPQGLRFKLLLMGLATLGTFSLNIFKPCLPFIRASLDASVPAVQLGLREMQAVTVVVKKQHEPLGRLEICKGT